MNSEQCDHRHKTDASSSQAKVSAWRVGEQGMKPTPGRSTIGIQELLGEERKNQIFFYFVFVFNGMTLVDQPCPGSGPTSKSNKFYSVFSILKISFKTENTKVGRAER